MNHKFLKWLCAGVVAASLSACALAQTTPYEFLDTLHAYDGNQFNLANNLQFGQDVYLNAANDSLTGFEFEYAVPGNYLSTSVGVDITFYNVNSIGAPTSVFYNSGFFTNNPLGSIPASTNGFDLIYGPADFEYGDGPGAITIASNYILPSQFLVSVQFDGMASNGEVTLPIATNNTTGYKAQLGNDYWVSTGGGWTEYTNAIGNNMMFSLTGVPEPTAFALAGLGGLALLGATKLKRKR